MLEFAAVEFVELSHRFGRLLGQSEQPDPDILGESLNYLLEHGPRLGLAVTVQHVYSLFAEVVGEHPERVTMTGNKVASIKGQVSIERGKHHVEQLYRTMIAEMETILFRAVPKERVPYCDPKWLSDTKIPEHFHTALSEFQRAGNCYALGEPTATVFHSMRAMEPGLNSLADRFGVSYEHDNWQNIIQDIEAKVRDLGKLPKSPQKVEDEKFFGAAASQLYFVKNAWRNHVAHTRDSYSDKEAIMIMQHCVQFIESLCPRLREP